MILYYKLSTSYNYQDGPTKETFSAIHIQVRWKQYYWTLSKYFPFALNYLNVFCLEGGCIHDSNRKNPLLSKWTQQHSYFQRLLVFSIRAYSPPCKQNHHDEWCEKRSKRFDDGSSFSINIKLQVGFSFTQEEMTELWKLWRNLSLFLVFYFFLSLPSIFSLIQIWLLLSSKPTKVLLELYLPKGAICMEMRINVYIVNCWYGM